MRAGHPRTTIVMPRCVAPIALGALLFAWIAAWGVRSGVTLPPVAWLFASVPSVVLTYYLTRFEPRRGSPMTNHLRHASILYILLLFGLLLLGEGLTHSVGMAIATCSLSMIVGNALEFFFLYLAASAP